MAENITGNARYIGYAVDLIDALAQENGFEYVFVPVADNAYGKYNKETKQWDGIIGELINNVGPVTIGFLSFCYYCSCHLGCPYGYLWFDHNPSPQDSGGFHSALYAAGHKHIILSKAGGGERVVRFPRALYEWSLDLCYDIGIHYSLQLHIYGKVSFR